MTRKELSPQDGGRLAQPDGIGQKLYQKLHHDSCNIKPVNKIRPQMYDLASFCVVLCGYRLLSLLLLFNDEASMQGPKLMRMQGQTKSRRLRGFRGRGWQNGHFQCRGKLGHDNNMVGYAWYVVLLYMVHDSANAFVFVALRLRS